MTNWKHYAGSILLAGLLLQGCGSSSEDGTDLGSDFSHKTVEVSNSSKLAESAVALSSGDVPESQEQLSLKLAQLSLNDSELEAYIQKIANDNGISFKEARDKLAEAMMTYTEADSAAAGSPSRAASRVSLLDGIKTGLVDILDSSVGDAITGAAFDVVLNSEGITVVMLDMARDSQTMTDIMINALDENWDLTLKMCPMLQKNSEFGEKFVALADERPNLGEFFFEKIDATMYGCLTDAMLLSNNEEVHHVDVDHSTTGYMGVLLEKYATTYFIEPGTGVATYKDASTDQFARLMFTTGDVVTYESGETTGRGDAVELVNEQFFYAMFKTPTSTDSFVAAMNKLPQEDVTMFMDEIFMGEQNTIAFGESQDTYQGYYNIIAIGSGMYDGIYGEKDIEGNRQNAYGFGSYTNAFVGFAGLIPANRYLAYGQSFISAGYHYAALSGINVWSSVTDIATTTAQDIWNGYTAQSDDSTVVNSNNAPARSAGEGIVSDNWINDTIALLKGGWGEISFLDIFNALISADESVLAEINAQAATAYATVVDGNLSANGTCTLPTTVQVNDSVCGFHGLIQLAMREDMVNSNVYTIDEANLFILPPFAELTWNFAYNAAKDGVKSYWDNNVNAQWLANVSDSDFMRTYIYPSEDGIVSAYIPNWMMSIDWLKLPNAVQKTNYDSIDLSFDGGYVDVYFISTVANLAQINELVTIELVDDSMIAQDADGNLTGTRYVYKIRAVSPEQVTDALNYLQSIGEGLIGLDTDNAAQTETEADNT